MKSVLRNLGLVGVIVAVGLVPGCGGDGPDEGGTSGFEVAQARAARMGYAALIYAGDSDDIFPLGSNWMDSLTPYIHEEYRADAFRSPAVPAPGYGFAFNSAAVARSLSSLDENTVTIFDSTVTSRNAVAGLETLPNPSRYPEGNARSTTSQIDPYPVPPLTPLDVAVSRLKQSSTALLLYTGDNDDLYPPSGVWMDALQPYAPNQNIFRSPAFDGTEMWGFAFNQALPGISQTSLEAPATTISLFDSTVTTRNAQAASTDRPNPGRYDGQNAVGYADGHVSTLSP